MGRTEVPTGDLVIPGELGGYTVTGFGGGLFSDCTELTSVTLPQGITGIGDGMFANCAALTRVDIPDSVQHIGFRAFAECSSLTDVTIPDSVMSIDEGAFALCESLTSLTIPDSVASLGEEAFLACSGLTSIVIPDSLTSINGHLFRACESLTSVIIPNSVTSIGEEAFRWCYSLSSVTIPASVTNIGEDAFDGCDELTLTVTKGSYAEQYAKENDILYVLVSDADAAMTEMNENADALGGVNELAGAWRTSENNGAIITLLLYPGDAFRLYQYQKDEDVTCMLEGVRAVEGEAIIVTDIRLGMLDAEGVYTQTGEKDVERFSFWLVLEDGPMLFLTNEKGDTFTLYPFDMDSPD